jgi:hypothetical protein
MNKSTDVEFHLPLHKRMPIPTAAQSARENTKDSQVIHASLEGNIVIV